MAPSNKISPLQRFGLLALLTVQNTATVLCIHYSRSHNNSRSTSSEINSKEDEKKQDSSSNNSLTDDAYLVTTLVLTMECIKLCITMIFLVAQMKCSPFGTARLLYNQVFERPTDTLQLAIPALLYILQDNLIIFALSYLDAVTYQRGFMGFISMTQKELRHFFRSRRVTYQGRILTTALFAKLLLDKKLTFKHWIALALLMLGVILVLVRFDDKTASWLSDSTDGKDSVLYLLGCLAVGCATLTSGFAGVYNEKVLKNGQQPMLFVRTFQLSIFAIFFAVLTVAIKDGERVRQFGFFHGYDPFIFFTAFLQAAGGVIVAATIKFADNILKTFATAISIVLSCLLSYFLFDDLNLTPAFTLGTIVIIVATLLYGKASSTQNEEEKKSNESATLVNRSNERHTFSQKENEKPV